MLSIKTTHLTFVLLLPFLFSACQPQATQEPPLNITQAIVNTAIHINENDIRIDIKEFPLTPIEAEALAPRATV